MSTTNSIWQNQGRKLRVALIDGSQQLIDILKNKQVPIQVTMSLDEAEQRLNEMSSFNIILVGVTLYPIRRRVIGELRRVAPHAGLVFLRRVPELTTEQNVLEVRDQVIADFMLSSSSPSDVWQAAESLTTIFPIPAWAELERPPEALLVEKAVKVVSQHYTDPSLNLQRVAEKLGLSSGQLSRVLNQHAGMRFRQLLQQTRLEAAKQMLASGQASVKEVAYSVGFSDSDYFSRAFKRYTGDCATTFKGNTSV
ncbi:MAG: AraC family transcriptional regulator [Blastocatellia bacterium]|nr:AraC family transcriptional regulator [Blastocatellia bacterium]